MKRISELFRRAMPRWLAVLVSGAFALTGVVAVSAAPASAAAGVQVYVGYADTVRAAAANFPTPWEGSPGVTYNGCTGSCEFDGGAVRIVNNTTLTETVDSLTVSFGTCTWDIWQHNVPLPPGQQFIITQTVSGDSNGCDNTSGQFDTSDVGQNGAAWAGNCTQSGAMAQINATIDGTLNTFTDTQQVLNTGGFDLGSCPSGSNESQQWSLIGTRCPGAQISLLPASQTEALGDTATLNATVTNSCGDPLQGVNVTFAVLSGPNAHEQFTTPTDANGVAIFSYTSSTTGTDTIQALASNPAGTFGSAHATVDWIQRQTSLSITGGATSSDYNDPATVAATLTDSAGPVVGQPVVFALNGSETCTGTTDASGSASCSITPQEPAGSYTLTATFAGSAADLGSTASSSFAITPDETTLTYTGPTTATNGQSFTPSGVLKEDGTTAIAGRSVTFTLGSGASAQSCTGTTDSSGAASCTIASASQAPSSTSVPVTAVFAGDSFYQHAAASATVIWLQQPTSLSITGGATSSDYNDAATVSARLTDTSGPVVGQPVVFVLNGSETCTGTTNASGSASCSITPQEPAGSYTLTASFAGSASDLPSSASAQFTVTREETTLAYTGPTKAANGQPLTLSGVLKEDGATPIAGRTVTFTLGSGASAQSCNGATTASGTASCTIASVNQPASSTSVPVTAVFAGDTFYLPASASATVKFQYLTGRAFGLQSSGLVGISPTPDTGAIQTASAGTFAPPCVATISGLVNAGTLCAKVTTSLNPGTSTATASVQNVGIGVLGLPVIKVGAVQSSSTTGCAGSTGSASIASISVGGIPVNVAVNPAPNTTISVLGVTLVFNEQIPVTGADQGLTVNGVHIKALGLLDVVIASSTSDIGNC